MKATIVTTTIYVPKFLAEYSAAAERNGHDVDFIVVGDAKTPPEAEEFCKTIPNCTFLNLAAQAEYLKDGNRWMLGAHLPVNSVERRNIGMLLAYDRGNHTVITLDDDNYATMHDAISGHNIVGRAQLLSTVGSSTGWYNVCSMLKEKNDVEFYHRGFPPAQRWRKSNVLSETQANFVAVNAGLWTDNPDVDAITRLERELNVVGFKNENKTRIALAPGTWSPFNCQNTALRRRVIPAYFLSPYAGRHADIFASYVVCKIAEHLGEVIAFGYPLARHTRSPHDLWKDLEAEKPAIQITDMFCDWLRGVELTAVKYHDCFGQIARRLKREANNHMLEKMAEGMLIWHNVFKEGE